MQKSRVDKSQANATTPHRPYHQRVRGSSILSPWLRFLRRKPIEETRKSISFHLHPVYGQTIVHRHRQEAFWSRFIKSRASCSSRPQGRLRGDPPRKGKVTLFIAEFMYDVRCGA
ncbi:hypothetical protein NL676_033678 [Syzygium grande]|nr:hypothetical protein NL676_033678 [Syzygium grande]